VLQDQLRLFAQWFNTAGISVPYKERAIPFYKLEVSPLYASTEEDFLKKADPNFVINRDTYLG
jgi:hypothetical protein